MGDPDSPDLEGDTPMHYAAIGGHVATLQLLLDAGADPECENFNSETPLEYAQMDQAYFLGVSSKDVQELIRTAMQEHWKRKLERLEDGHAGGLDEFFGLGSNSTNVEEFTRTALAHDTRTREGWKEQLG